MPNRVQKAEPAEQQVAKNATETTNETLVTQLANQQQSDTLENPEKWPLLENIDIADSLVEGITVVLLYHYDCPDCLEAIPIYLQFSDNFQGSEDAFRFAFIEIPPYAPPGKSPIPSESLCLSGKLDRSEEGVFQTPLIVVLWDGVLVKKWQEGYKPQLDEILQTVFPSEE